ncbi:MAG: SCP2 sterol-binding domain-containing protein [Aquificaceae bacterium]|nr:SCP2 sterol-binding domain-containing protein [Aquificaceae bacterium]MDW8097238.1 SCP2 sterol-binding domain-containing protein [Aquificaceae bacterium]
MRRVLLAFTLTVGTVYATPVFMDGEYAKALCELWNKTPQLSEQLGKSESWMSATERRLFIYREECGDSRQIQLTIRNEGGRAQCVYGGPAKDRRGKEDFLMYAETRRWLEMGKKEYGPMKAMMLNRLKFEGPKGVAMKNMGPFEAFLDMVDNAPHDASRCP